MAGATQTIPPSDERGVRTSLVHGHQTDRNSLGIHGRSLAISFALEGGNVSVSETDVEPQALVTCPIRDPPSSQIYPLPGPRRLRRIRGRRVSARREVSGVAEEVVPTSLNGQPAGLAYVRMDDGRWVSVCMTVMTLEEDGRVSAMDVFVLPQQFEAWGHPTAIE